MTAIRLSRDIHISANAARLISKIIAGLVGLLASLIIAQAQSGPEHYPDDPNARVIEGVSNSTVFGLGQSIKIKRTLNQAPFPFGAALTLKRTADAAVPPISA